MRLSSTRDASASVAVASSKLKFVAILIRALTSSSSSSSSSLPTTTHHDVDTATNAIDRIALRFRNLGLASVHHADHDGFLRREWIHPDRPLFQWDKQQQQQHQQQQKLEEHEKEKLKKKKKKKNVNAAESKLEKEDLRRLLDIGMRLKERVTIPKAGLTRPVLDEIHNQWKHCELVRLKFHEHLAHNMNLALQIVQRRTKGLVIWRSGSYMWVYRGRNYQGPMQPNDRISVPVDGNAESQSEGVSWKQEWVEENMTPEEMEFDRMLDDFGPRFVEWWGTGILPVDADLLPPTVPGYNTPLRLLPVGMHPRLTNDELTNMRKLARSLPCHFALGRNRNLQGLASAILRLWERSLVAKIGVKRGIANTNNELMAQELKKLTGGTLLLRNKYYIVIFRGKDFVPTSVAAVIAERQTKQVQDVEEKVQCKALSVTSSGEDESTAQAGPLAEFYEAPACLGWDTSTEEREKMKQEDTKAKNAKLDRKIERKLAVARAKRFRAEKLLAKIETSLVPAGPDYDKETITDEERVMFRSVGLRMKTYLPLGILGDFDGVVENMHSHWRHRELVKLITKQKTLAFVEDTARLLEYKSGGILVAIEKVPKGFSLIYYRGKNYKRLMSRRPRNLITKENGLQHSIAIQHHEALSQHITELGKKIEEMKKELGMSQDLGHEDRLNSEDHNQLDRTLEFTLGEDQYSAGDDNYGDINEECTDCNDKDSEF